MQFGLKRSLTSFLMHTLLVLEGFCMILTNYTDHNKTAFFKIDIQFLTPRHMPETKFLFKDNCGVNKPIEKNVMFNQDIRKKMEINMRPFRCLMITICAFEMTELEMFLSFYFMAQKELWWNFENQEEHG